MSIETRDVHIGGCPVALDRDSIYTLLSTLSEQHGRICAEIGDCGDMEVANKRAVQLHQLTRAYNVVERTAAELDNREAKLINDS